ncbi:MAG: amidohydrolase family protein [Rubripirellula sp.]
MQRDAKTSLGVTRRQFAGSLAAVASAAWLGSEALSAEESKFPGWIDAHVHVWTPDTTRYPLDSGYSVANMKPASFTPAELFAECRPAGVSRIVLIQMSFYNFDNRYMLDSIAAHPGVFSGVGIVDHRAPDVSEKMRELADKGVRGFRLHARGDAAKSWGDDPGMLKVWQTASQTGLKVCPLINPSDLPYVDALCAKFPEAGVVVDHFGRVGISGTIVPEELDALCRLARFPNVHVKTSAFYALGKKQPPYKDLRPMIARMIDAFGPQRLMWASDCPYQVQGIHDYESSIALIRDHIESLSQSDRDWILRKTAEQAFFS